MIGPYRLGYDVNHVNYSYCCMATICKLVTIYKLVTLKLDVQQTRL